MTLAAAESGTAFRTKSQRGQKKVPIFLPFFIGLQVCERGKSTMCTLHCLAVAKKYREKYFLPFLLLHLVVVGSRFALRNIGEILGRRHVERGGFGFGSASAAEAEAAFAIAQHTASPFLLPCVIQGCIMCLSSSGVSWGGRKAGAKKV